jgi:hypothetical protein
LKQGAKLWNNPNNQRAKGEACNIKPLLLCLKRKGIVMGAFEGRDLIHMTGFRGHAPIMGSYGYELAFESEKLNHMTINRGRAHLGGLIPIIWHKMGF